MNILFNIFFLALLPMTLLAAPGVDAPGVDAPGVEVPTAAMLCGSIHSGPEGGAVEKRKTIIKMYDVTPKDNLVIDNQYGKINVNLWDKDEIRVQITITANAGSDDKVQDNLSLVEIDERRAGDQIILKTQIRRPATSTWMWASNNEKNNVKIDYDISMPRRNPLNVRNQFGTTNIPAFSAPLTVHSRYGSFYANDLQSRQNTIDIAYGKAEIKNLESGKLDIAYSSLDVDKANVLILSNKSGSMNIGEVGKLDADIGYSGGKVGTVRESGKIRLSFASGFRIDQLPKSVDNLDIQANYSTVTLPITESSDCNFDVTVSYGGFQYPTGQNFHFFSQPNNDDSKGPKLIKQYSGKVGSGSGTKVKVVSKYGSVRFK